MSDSKTPAKTEEKTGTVKIDRLILDIPGFDPAQASQLARDIGQHLAQTNATGDHKTISLALGPQEANSPDLALRIARALMQRLSP